MIRLVHSLSRAAQHAAGLILPHQCVLCRCFAESTGLCASCWGGLAPIGAPVCQRCGLPLGHTLAEPVCAACWQAPPPLAMIRAALHYNENSRQLILRFKHGDGLQLTPFLAAMVGRDFDMMTKATANSVTDGSVTDGSMTDTGMTDTGVPLVIPVPLHRQRYFLRRYNQSAELARHLCHSTGTGHFAPEILIRRRPTASQGGLSRRQRHRNLIGAFAVDGERRAQLEGRQVILIDDVMTTGATLFAAAKCLTAAGSGPVSALVLARVARPPAP